MNDNKFFFIKQSLWLVFLAPVLSGFVHAGTSIWHKSSNGIYESAVETIAVHPQNSAVIFAGTSRALYKSADAGKNYRPVLAPSGESVSVNFVYISREDRSVIYAATQAGLYESVDTGEAWRRIYYAADADSRNCTAVLRHEGMIYLATAGGLLYRKQSEETWHAMKGDLGNEAVYHLTGGSQFLYAATAEALFILGKDGAASRIFSAGVRIEEESADEPAPVELSIRFIRPCDDSGACILAAAAQGIYRSEDHGARWETVASDNIPLRDLTALAVVEASGILIGTQRGAFWLSKGQGMPVYQGMETNRVNDLAMSAEKTVYAATDKGVFSLPLEKALPFFDIPRARPDTDAAEGERRLESLDKYFDGEPAIGEVQRLAVDYAEVHPQKIAQWRVLARRRAWLPELDVGFDGGRDWSSSDSIYGTTTGGGAHYVGPDDKTRGEDFGWDVTLSWNLADLIWSTEQTTIDSRSKLMVELREDVLDQVTRIYFERRRNQIELLRGGVLDPALRMDKELRVAELTALLDAFTGGEFSRRIQKRPGEENLSIAAQTKEKEELS